MLRTALKGIAANRLRFALTGLAVVLGVAFVTGSFVFTDTINARFETLFTDVYAGVDATIRPDGSAAGAEDDHLTEALLDEVRATEGVARAHGSVGGVAQLIDGDGEPIGGQGPPTLGFSWLEDPSLNALRIEEGNGRAPTAPGELVIDVTTATSNGFQIGDRVAVQTRAGMESFTLTGLASFGTEDNLAGATLAAFELSEAQRLFDMENRFTAIDVVAADGIGREALVARLTQVVPEGIEVISGEQNTQEELDQVTEGLGFLGAALLAFAGVAVFVGAFVIQNTFRITIAQRVRELALLRAVGATASQVTRMVLIEAAVLGLSASAAGVGVGVVVAELIKAALTSFGIGIPDGSLTVELRTVAVALSVGLVVTIGSALLPARRAAAIPPVAAMSEPASRPTRRSLRRRAIVGSTVSALGGVLTAIGLLIGNGGTLALVSIGAVGLFLGASALAPLVVVPVARTLSRPIRGITGTLARENTIRQPRRTASTASALMIGVALVAFVSIFAASIKASVSDTLESTFPADLAFTSTNVTATVSPVALERLRDVDELAVVSGIHTGVFEIDGESLNVAGVEPDTIRQVYDLAASIDLSELDDGMLVHSAVLTERGWEVGQSITVDFPRSRSHQLEIVGTFDVQQFGGFIVSDETFTAHAAADQIGIAFARAAEGATVEESRAAAEVALSGFPAIDVNTKSEHIAAAEDQVDQLVALFSGLLGLALVIALLGIANTLALSIVERTREIGLLRAVGMARRQVRRMIRWEAIITAVFGAVLGVGIGSVIGAGVVWSLADDGLGTIALPGAQLGVWLGLAAVAGVVAAVGPARKAARLDVLQAISTE